MARIAVVQEGAHGHSKGGVGSSAGAQVCLPPMLWRFRQHVPHLQFYIALSALSLTVATIDLDLGGPAISTLLTWNIPL